MRKRRPLFCSFGAGSIGSERKRAACSNSGGVADFANVWPRGSSFDDRADQASIRKKVVVAGRKVVVDFLNTGVPHAVLFVRSVRSIDVAKQGRAIRYHSAFAPSGTNVNFVEIGRGNRIHVRTYERGVEGETLACGTGVVAASILSNLRRGLRSPILVTTRGGDNVRVGFSMVNGQARKVTLQGPARMVYTGVIHV